MNKLLKSLSVLLPLFFASIACADPAGYAARLANGGF